MTHKTKLKCFRHHTLQLCTMINGLCTWNPCFLFSKNECTVYVLCVDEWTLPCIASELLASGYVYRPQRSCGKVMFLHLSVSHSVHRGGSASGSGGGVCHTPPCADTPLGRYPLSRHTPGQTFPLARHPPLGQTPHLSQTPPWPDTPLGRHLLPSACWDKPPLPSACWDTYPLPSACWDMVNQREVRIPLGMHSCLTNFQKKR